MGYLPEARRLIWLRTSIEHLRYVEFQLENTISAIFPLHFIERRFDFNGQGHNVFSNKVRLFV